VLKAEISEKNIAEGEITTTKSARTGNWIMFGEGQQS
jgi:hypothetical protein